MHVRTLGSARGGPHQNNLRLGTVGAVPATLAAATFPSYLPHRPVSLGVMIALSWLAGRGLANRGVRAVARRTRNSSWHRSLSLDGPARTAVLALCAAVTLGLFGEALSTQNAMRSELGMSPITTREVAVAGSVAALLIGGLGALRRVFDHVSSRRIVVVALVAGSVLTAIYPLRATADPPTADTQILLQDSDAGAVRAYAALADEPNLNRRAALAADRMVRAGGLDREHLVLAVPTGSGWVDLRLVFGLEERFGADVATVAMQYDDRPSWLSFAFGRDEATRGARALFTAVLQRVEALPATERPQVHVVGESLGATAGQNIFRGPNGVANRARVCSTMWVGTPGGGEVGMAREASVANADDPIVHAHPSMLLKPPGDGRPWLPVISFVQAGTDYVSSLAVPNGAGHRYGPEQAYELPTCA